MVITDKDRRIIRNWRASDIIAPVGESTFQSSRDGAILVMCGDCDRSGHMIDTIQDFQPRLHLKAYNGGPLRLNPKVPIPDNLRCEKQLLQGLVGSQRLKNLSGIILLSHWPCGMAGAINYDVRQTLWNTLETADLLCQQLSLGQSLISTLFHVDDNSEMSLFEIKRVTQEEVFNSWR